MSEFLDPNEGEHLSPMQRMASHIENITANQPVDPETGLQAAIRHVNGYERSTVMYIRNPTTHSCQVTIDIVTPQQWHTRWPNFTQPRPQSSFYQTFIFTRDQRIIDLTAHTNGEPTHPAFAARMTELLLGLEPSLTERPLNAFGRVLLQLRSSKK